LAVIKDGKTIGADFIFLLSFYNYYLHLFRSTYPF
jgi:hypothetical protein